jgi:CRISPR/Cas system-associated exonuclease Cas4 (RecB family)
VKYNQSELKAYLKCGKMWEFRYLKGMKTPPSAALTLGSSVDTAVTVNLLQKVSSGVDLPKADVLDAYSSDFEKRKAETEWQDENPGKQKDIGVRLVALHHEELAPRLDPATVQENFILKTNAGYDLHGTMDLVEKDGTVVDTKTSRLRYEEDAVSKNFQPALYDFAFESLRKVPSRGFRFDVLVKPTATRGPTLQQVEAKVTQTDREWLFDAIQNVHKAIQAGVALPAPEGSWYCSKKWCGYWDQCKGRNK